MKFTQGMRYTHEEEKEKENTNKASRQSLG